MAAHGGIPPRTYLVNARAHHKAANILTRAGQHDFASFHLITAMEELARAKVEEVVETRAFKGLSWEGKPVLGQVSGARRDHDFKVPTGMLLVALNSLKLYDAEIELTSPSLPSEGRAELREKLAREFEWLAELFGTTEGIRELAIYAGWDRKEIPRPVVDWKRVTGILSPVIERELTFQEFLLDHPLDHRDIAKVREEFLALSGKKGEPPT